MENEKDDLFKKLIRQAGTDTPSPAFEDSVMRHLQELAQLETAREFRLKSVLKQHAVEKPSFAFATGVMLQIKKGRAGWQPVSVAKPIIHRGTWYLVAAMGLALLCFSGWYFVSFGKLEGNAAGTTALENVLFMATNNLLEIPPLYSLIVIATGCLVLLDYFLRSLSNRWLARAGKRLG